MKPYTAPKGSIEHVENLILMGVGVAAILFGFVFIILSEMV